MATDYATAAVDIVEAADDGESTGHRSFTDELGCFATTVDGYRVPQGAAVSLPAPPEQACLPIDADRSVSLGDLELPPLGVARVPAGVERTLRPVTATKLLVVGAAAEREAGAEPTAVALEDCEFTTPSTSAIATARLTDRLGYAGMKLNARVLDPGQRVPYHTEGTQEELFVPLCGPATMRIDDDTYETPVGTVTRVAPPVPRAALNDGDAEALWVMIGAPPTGGPSEWDPGAEVVE